MMVRIRRILLAYFAIAIVTSHPVFAQKSLTLDDIFDPQKKVNFNGVVPRIVWESDGESYLLSTSSRTLSNQARRGAPSGWTKVDVASSVSAPLNNSGKTKEALMAAGIKEAQAAQLATLVSATFNEDYTKALLEAEKEIYYYDLRANRVIKLTDTPDSEEEEESFSPNGKQVAFVRDNNLYVVDIDTQATRALTTDGNKTKLNGILDWVYEEEVYGRGMRKAYWWSPDSTRIAYLQLDDSQVPTFTVVDDVPQSQTVEVTAYPKVGDPNPIARLAIADVSGNEQKWVDLSAYDKGEFIITRVGWNPDGKHLLYQVQNRIQTWLDLNSADPSTDKTDRILREEGKAWVDVVELPVWLPDNTFVWQSDRTGRRHLYHYSAEGKLLGQITKGDWDVRQLYGASQNDTWIYFIASEHSPISNDLYRVRPDGTGFTRLSTEDANIRADFNPQFTSYIAFTSTILRPTQTRVYSADGKLIRVIEENNIAALAQYNLIKPEFMQVKTRDGFVMEAMMIKPAGFDPHKKYPVMSYTYSGPAAPSVRNQWSEARALWHQLLAQKGYIIWICDNRSGSDKGIESTATSYRNFGEGELRDLEDGVAYLKSLPFVDSERIGLWGWSFGGFMTSFALTHSKSFKIGIAGGLVSDWHNYDSIYTERYMGLPSDNKEGYEKSSVYKSAANLHGKLMILHGMIDDNVHIQNSVQFINALQLAGKDFQLMLYPQSRHGVVEPHRVKHMYALMTKFVLENL